MRTVPVSVALAVLSLAAGAAGNLLPDPSFEEQYMPLRKNGSFGWTPLSFVGEVKQKREFGHPSFGLMAPGYLWVDDVSVERVGDEVPLTPEPLLGREEKPIAAPGELGEGALRCVECGFRNMPAWGGCFACGTRLEPARVVASGPAVRPVTSFEDRNPFDGGTVVGAHATDGGKALRLDRNYAVMEAPQDWSGYDYLKADVHTDAGKPLQLYFEVRDRETRDYWTRVNYTTIVPPGSSTLIIPTALYVGEKSRPGRPLMLGAISRVVFSIGEHPEAPLFLDNIRLERDSETAAVRFDGLWAFDLGTATSPLMEGFTALDTGKAYSKGRGFGWMDARFWRSFDALQPDPLYQDFICVEGGGLAIDVPNGRYQVVVNMDSPSGFWGEYQTYRRRALVLEGEAHEETMDFEGFRRRYFRFWDTEDLPADDTFDKYQLPYFSEKEFEVEVRDGQLNVEFSGENWACSVSAIIVYPAAKSAPGRRFLDFAKARRRFHFDNYFKRTLHGADQPVVAASGGGSRGFLVFRRDWMDEVYYNDRPGGDDVVLAADPGGAAGTLSASAFAGESVPVTFSIVPARELGRVTVGASDLRGPAAVIPAAAIDAGYVSYRLSRVTMEGSVYTIAPRFVMPLAGVAAPQGVTRRFWLTVKVPADAAAGLYRGTIGIEAQQGGPLTLPLELTVRKGTLDPLDVPAGPWSHTIDLPWPGDEAAGWNRGMAEKSLRKLRDCGFTTCSGLPAVTYRGFENGAPVLDFTVGDEQMRRMRELGFSMPVVTYTAFGGLNTYYQDAAAMEAAGFRDYSAFVKALFGAVQQHAEAAGWLPVYWNIGDEPLGDDLVRSARNAEAYQRAFPQGPPWFTAASSFSGRDRDDPHFRLSRALHVADWNGHDEAGVRLLHEAGGDWAFYNGGNRWTYGVYLYKAARQFDLKFRLSWHWNAAAGDPYYALDCREDDYSWCSAGPDGQLIPSVHFEQLRAGLGDYRRMLTLARLAMEAEDTPASRSGGRLLARILSGFKLGDRELQGVAGFTELRAELDAAIEALR